jgi:hypothetical protein
MRVLDEGGADTSNEFSHARTATVAAVMTMMRGICCNVGLGNEVQARVTAMEGQATEAAQKLTSAAASGTCAAYRSALDAAVKFSHLGGLVNESERVFTGRRLEAEKELQAAVDRRPLQVSDKF